jgi:hypothetical protein
LYGDTPGNTPDVIKVKFDSGRTGCPALDITITRPGIQGGPFTTVTSVTIAYEPGVHAGNDREDNALYDLHTFGARWQGGSGGGGHMFANDPTVVQA